MEAPEASVMAPDSVPVIFCAASGAARSRHPAQSSHRFFTKISPCLADCRQLVLEDYCLAAQLCQSAAQGIGPRPPGAGDWSTLAFVMLRHRGYGEALAGAAACRLAAQGGLAEEVIRQSGSRDVARGTPGNSGAKLHGSRAGQQAGGRAC